MRRACATLRVVVVACTGALTPAGARGQATSTPSPKRVCVGKIGMMSPDGMTPQLHRFAFVEEGRRLPQGPASLGDSLRRA